MSLAWRNLARFRHIGDICHAACPLSASTQWENQSLNIAMHSTATRLASCFQRSPSSLHYNSACLERLVCMTPQHDCGHVSGTKSSGMPSHCPEAVYRARGVALTRRSIDMMLSSKSFLRLRHTNGNVLHLLEFAVRSNASHPDETGCTASNVDGRVNTVG